MIVENNLSTQLYALKNLSECKSVLMILPLRPFLLAIRPSLVSFDQLVLQRIVVRFMSFNSFIQRTSCDDNTLSLPPQYLLLQRHFEPCNHSSLS